jgi:hypothetical protein
VFVHAPLLTHLLPKAALSSQMSFATHTSALSLTETSPHVPRTVVILVPSRALAATRAGFSHRCSAAALVVLVSQYFPTAHCVPPQLQAEPVIFVLPSVLPQFPGPV